MGRERKEEEGGMRIGRREEAIVKEDAGEGGRHSVDDMRSARIHYQQFSF